MPAPTLRHSREYARETCQMTVATNAAAECDSGCCRHRHRRRQRRTICRPQARGTVRRLDPYWTWVRRWTACPSPTCGPPLHGMRRLPDHHDGTPPHVCQHLQARCLNPHPLAHRASAAVGQRPRWSRRMWVILRSGPWHTSQQLLGRFFVLSPSGEVTFDYVKTPPPAIVCSGRTLGEK